MCDACLPEVQLGPLVANGNYDLIGPDDLTILPQAWELLLEPDMEIRMRMWPQTLIIPPKRRKPRRVGGFLSK
jgi:hypothetical protein